MTAVWVAMLWPDHGECYALCAGPTRQAAADRAERILPVHSSFVRAGRYNHPYEWHGPVSVERVLRDAVAIERIPWADERGAA
jgi:hypothetical protein